MAGRRKPEKLATAEDLAVRKENATLIEARDVAHKNKGRGTANTVKRPGVKKLKPVSVKDKRLGRKMPPGYPPFDPELGHLDIVSGKRRRIDIVNDICTLLIYGSSLLAACCKVDDANYAQILRWVDDYPEISRVYNNARRHGYLSQGDRILELSAETHATVKVHKQDSNGKLMFDCDGNPILTDVIAPLSSDVIASKRLQVETLKWTLAKMLPKVYGDKLTLAAQTESSAPGEVAVTVDKLTSLSDDELIQLQRLMLKASGTPLLK